MATWIRANGRDFNYTESLDGVLWADAPLPYPWHKCATQTRGWIGLNYYERCACGATRLNNGAWMNKNETRKGRARDRREARKPRAAVTCRICGQPYEAAEGSHQAREERCNRCWADALVAMYGPRS